MAADPMLGPAAAMDPAQGPPQDPTLSPVAPDPVSPDPPGGPAGPDPSAGIAGGPMDPQALEAGMEDVHDMVADDVAQAIMAGCIQAKAFAEGDPQSIDPAAYKDVAQGVNLLLLGLAAIKPPAPVLDPNVVAKDATTSASAVLQDQQAAEARKVQLELGKQRQGRPSGQSKPQPKT